MSTVLIGTSAWRGASRQGSGGLFRLDTATQAWTQISEVPEGGVQGFAADRRTGVLYAGSADGVFRSHDKGAHWERCGTGSEGIAVWAILIDPRRPGTIIAGGGPRSILRSTDNGETWRAVDLPEPENVFVLADDGVTLLPFSARVTGIAAAGDDPDVLYAAIEVEGVLRSLDGGQTWHDSSAGLLALATEPHLAPKIGKMDGRKSMADGHAIVTHGKTVFFANRLGLFRSDDRGDTWQDVRLDRVSPLTYVRSIVVAPDRPDTFYAALSVKSGGDDGTVWRSDDAGANWRRFDQGIVPDSTIMAVTVRPDQPSAVYATSYSGQVFGTDDGGKTWQTWPGPQGATESVALACPAGQPA